MAKAKTAALTTSISNAAGAFRDWMKGLASAGLISFVIGLAPVPAARPRISKWGTYYPATYTKWMKAAKPFAMDYEGPGVDGPCIVLIESVSLKPKTGERDHPRGDTDNFAKGPLDVITKASTIWKDDDQVVGLAIFKRYSKPGEEPGSYISICPLE